METRVLPFTDQVIAEAARLIAAGEPVAVPTETVYGLGRKGDELAAGQCLRGAPDGPMGGRNDGHCAISRVTTNRSS